MRQGALRRPITIFRLVLTGSENRFQPHGSTVICTAQETQIYQHFLKFYSYTVYNFSVWQYWLCRWGFFVNYKIEDNIWGCPCHGNLESRTDNLQTMAFKQWQPSILNICLKFDCSNTSAWMRRGVFFTNLHAF